MDDTAKIWIVDDEPSVRFPIYTRGNAGEVFPNVVTPLTGSLFAEASVTAQTALFLELGFIVPSDLEDGAAPLTGVFGGYLYLNLSIGRLAGARSPGLTPDAIDTQLYGTYGAPRTSVSAAIGISSRRRGSCAVSSECCVVQMSATSTT